MPFNGSGTFVPAVTFANNTPATAEDQNAQDLDIAGGLSNCMTRDGQAPATANINMGGFRLQGLGTGIESQDAVSVGQLSIFVPPGVLWPYAGAAAPAGFLLCYGQAISRTTYAALFAAIGTLWGAGDSSTTFNVPDLRGRLPAGADNMGGTPAERLSGYTVGVVGGEQNHTLVTGQIPAHNHTDSGHTHTVTDPGHFHGIFVAAVVSTSGSGFGVESSVSTTNTQAATTGISINSGAANIQNTGGGGAHNNVQPTAGCNYIIKF